VGFRADGRAAAGAWTVQGDAYFGDIDQAPAGRQIAGGNLLARYTRAFDDGGTLSVQGYWDRTHRDHRQQFRETLDTLDFEAQYARRAGIHRIVLGGGYRSARDRIDNSALQAFLPPDRTLDWSNAFVQDEITLAQGLSGTLGAKVEHNVYTGSEFLPTARVTYQPRFDTFFWAAASRAVRAPTRFDRELFIPGQPPFTIAGNDTFRSEIADVYELGVRGQPAAAVAYAVTLFHAVYDRLRSVARAPTGLVFANGIDGHANGVEAWGTWRVTPTWRLAGGITALRERLQVKPGETDFGGLAALGDDPPAWWSLRSYWDISPRHELDVTVRRTGERSPSPVPAYTALDVRMGWRALPGLDLSLLVSDVFDPRHSEWSNRALLDRGVFLKATWSY